MHGDLPRWRTALAALPEVAVERVRLDAATVAVDGHYRAAGDRVRLEDALAALMPWRKGPYRLVDVTIDCEWRSDLKWARLAPHLAPLAGRTVLDVGSGSGYHLWRMRGAGAAAVLGIDPSPLWLCQFEAVARYARAREIARPVALLPLALETLPEAMSVFDTVFSMGVLYHRREPLAHLAALGAMLAADGELVLETLVAPGADDREIVPPAGRYAGMPNVRSLPSLARVLRWLERTGFAEVRPLSIDVTGSDEQRATRWMRGHSLIDALDPADPALTVEGLPRPRRALLLARRGAAIASPLR